MVGVSNHLSYFGQTPLFNNKPPCVSYPSKILFLGISHFSIYRVSCLDVRHGFENDSASKAEFVRQILHMGPGYFTDS